MANPYVGEIRMFGGNFEPVGWRFCWGQELFIAEHETLFQLIGTTYGGDGQTYFNLPNLAGRIPMHRATGVVPGVTGGVESVTLTTNQIPSHTHALNATTALANVGMPGNALPAQAATVQLYAEDTPAAALAPQALGPAGGGQPHDNMHPFAGLNFIISLFGIWPSET